MNRAIRIATGLFAGFLVTTSFSVFLYLEASLPELDGTETLPGLSAPVTVRFDRYAVPSIEAQNRLDAFRALGFLTARDRLFQLELFRRAAQGRLAEVLGPELVPLDLRQRHFGFVDVARRIFRRMPSAQRRVLSAYAEGVNAWLRKDAVPPPELLVLGIRPEPWRPEHSILVSLNMYQALNFTGHKEEMLTVMSETLPPEVVAFLTPDSDQYTKTLTGGPESRRPLKPVPVEALEALYRANGKPQRIGARLMFDGQLGSNGWAVSGPKTSDGRAILANDMHLPLIAPNIWYKARLRYGDTVLTGITLPGLPMLVSGTNGRVAWGYTNALADVIDLVTLEINPDDENEYLGPEGWTPFERRPETIRIRGEKDLPIQILRTVWGPVSERTLLGRLTAVRWTALDPEAVDLALIDLDRVRNVDEAVEIFNRAGSPVLNVLLADAEGSIAWTLTGRIPKRSGFDGSISLRWGNRPIGWSGYLDPGELPRVKNPDSGYLASANNLLIGSEFPYPIGQNFANGYRAFRIRERLASMHGITERSMLNLQADTRTELYDFYRDLGLSVLTDQALRTDPPLRRIRENLEAWNGRAKSDSQGMGVLFGFRRRLAGEIILPLLKRCYDADKRFFYSWFNMDTPLRQILSARPPDMLPRTRRYRDWDDLILKVLVETVQRLETRHGIDDINRLVWSDINPGRISHPFSKAVPGLSDYLDYPDFRLSGCTFCVNVIAEDYGVTERLVVSPGHTEDALLELPGGESGNPFSDHYDDLHFFWARLAAMPLEPESSRHELRLVP